MVTTQGITVGYAGFDDRAQANVANKTDQRTQLGNVDNAMHEALALCREVVDLADTIVGSAASVQGTSDGDEAERSAVFPRLSDTAQWLRSEVARARTAINRIASELP